MSMKDMFNTAIKQLKETNKPENVKERLKNQIEIERLKIEKDKLSAERRKMKYKNWSVGDIKIGDRND